MADQNPAAVTGTPLDGTVFDSHCHLDAMSTEPAGRPR